MDRYRRIARLWNWLPHFRAVAETGSLAMASSAVNVTSPALSRTIRLLEEDIGQPLFDRSGRTLTLNPAGELLLKEVRDSMRRIHNCLEQVSSPAPEQVRITASGPIARLFVFPLFKGIEMVEPKGHLPHVFKIADSTIGNSLRQGVVDIAITPRPPSEAELHVEKLMTLTCSVYCGTTDMPEKNEFVVPTDTNDWGELDGWPPDASRDVTLRVACFQGALDALSYTKHLAFLPDVIAESQGLHKVLGSRTGSLTLYMVRRTLLPHKGAIDVFADQILDNVRSLASSSSLITVD